MGCANEKSAVATAHREHAGPPQGGACGIKLLEFKVRGSKPGRRFDAEITCVGSGGSGGSFAAQVAKKDLLPTTWKHFSVYAAQVVFTYHNDQGPEFNIHLDPATGVRLLGEDVLSNASLQGSGWAPDNPRWAWLREHGNLHWQGKYEMAPRRSLEKPTSRRLLEFRVRGSAPGRRFSAGVVLQDSGGRTICSLTLLNDLVLPLEMETYCFDVEHVAFTYHNDQGPEFNIHLDPAMGVLLLGENVLPSASLQGSGWAPDNPRWAWLREHGNLHWQGKYEMRPSSEDGVMALQVEMPTYWHIGEEGTESKRVPETPEACQAFQSLLDSTWKATVTRDREKDFEETPGGEVQRFQVVEVMRNENPSLWVPYWRQRERIRRQCEGKSSPSEIEMVKTSLCEEFSRTAGHASLCSGAREFYLFHGTQPSAANAICSSDFRVDLAGSHKGTLYGKGIYFAEASSKSDEYASDDADGLYCMLLCKVSCGNWIYNDEAKPDVETLVQAIQSGQHHSILGDREKARGTYREFVVFNNDQVYPEYIIVYKRVDP